MNLNDRIARRVRSLRTEANLSLDELAVKSGVSKSMISLIERGETSATAVVLEKLASAFNVALAALFEDASAPVSPVSRSVEHVPWKDPQTGYVRRNLSPPNFASPLQLVDVVLPPGQRVAYDTARPEPAPHQQIWVRSGTIEVTVGRTTHRLEEDDCLAMQLNVPTAFRNPTRKPARYVVAITR
jgi:transcriptional regulator with XRE-family HTH domain